MCCPIRTAAFPLLLACTLAVACATPPDKEIQEARTALDAARAAGADQYAPQEYQDATATLQKAQEAVLQRDYRSALSFALDSHEKARDAVKAAAAGKAAVRQEVERTLSNILGLANQLRGRIKTAEALRLPRQQREAVSNARRTIVTTNVAVQKTGEALRREDYLAARVAMENVAGSLKNAIASVDAAIATAPARRRR